MSETPATKPPNILDYVRFVLLFVTAGMVINTVENVSLTKAQLQADIDLRKIELSVKSLEHAQDELAWRMTQ